MRIKQLQTELRTAHKKCLSLMKSLEGCDNPQSLEILNMAKGREAALFAAIQACRDNCCYLNLLK